MHIYNGLLGSSFQTFSPWILVLQYGLALISILLFISRILLHLQVVEAESWHFLGSFSIAEKQMLFLFIGKNRPELICVCIKSISETKYCTQYFSGHKKQMMQTISVQ